MALLHELLVQPNEPIRVLCLVQRAQPFQVRMPLAEPGDALGHIKARIFQHSQRQSRLPSHADSRIEKNAPSRATFRQPSFNSYCTLSSFSCTGEPSMPRSPWTQHIAYQSLNSKRLKSATDLYRRLGAWVPSRRSNDSGWRRSNIRDQFT